MSSKKRELTYYEAINNALEIAFKLDKNVELYGQLVDYESGLFGTTTGLKKKFNNQIFDFPVSESAMTLFGLGMSIAGKRIILTHHRIDFMLYATDAITNWVSLWRFKSGGKSKVPLVIRAVVGKGWGQGPQHSKSFHSWFAQLPGLNVIVPSTPYDAKGMLLKSIFSDNPTLIIEHRSLFNDKQKIDLNHFEVDIGKACLRDTGDNLTIVYFGSMSNFANELNEKLKKDKIFSDVIDLRSLSPLDHETVIKSVKKTQKVLLLEPDWGSFGIMSEIVYRLKIHINVKFICKRISYPDSHTPMSSSLEKLYYPSLKKYFLEIKNTFNF